MVTQHLWWVIPSYALMIILVGRFTWYALKREFDFDFSQETHWAVALTILAALCWPGTVPLAVLWLTPWGKRSLTNLLSPWRRT